MVTMTSIVYRIDRRICLFLQNPAESCCSHGWNRRFWHISAVTVFRFQQLLKS